MTTRGRTGVPRVKINQIRRSVQAGQPMSKQMLTKFTGMKPELILPMIRSFDWGKDFQYSTGVVETGVSAVEAEMAAHRALTEKLESGMIEDLVNKRVAEALAKLNAPKEESKPKPKSLPKPKPTPKE